MKLTILSLTMLFIIFAFAGVAPFSQYKDSVTFSLTDWVQSLKKVNENSTLTIEGESQTVSVTKNFQSTTSLTTSSTTTSSLNTTRPTANNIIDKNGFKIFENIQPPYSQTLGIPVSLINNQYAVNPSWEQLLAFIALDPTDKMTYIDDIVVCSRFAQEVHNNAEKAGFRAAWVALGLSDYPDGHACNAFMTTNKGLVFVDCTGGKLSIQIGKQSSVNHDKIAYICIGKDCGMITLGYASSPDYSFYTEYMNKDEKYRADLEQYNLEQQRYINELGGRTQLPEPEYSYFLAWYNELNMEYTRLQGILATIGGTWESLGAVTEVKIYW